MKSLSRLTNFLWTLREVATRWAISPRRVTRPSNFWVAFCADIPGHFHDEERDLKPSNLLKTSSTFLGRGVFSLAINCPRT